MQNRTADSINGNPGEIHTPIEAMSEPKRTPNRLILCFDGTGNSFQGNTSDTNIVKLYDKLDAMAPHQMHYYQRKSADSTVNMEKEELLLILCSIQLV
jgi:uncharacterized protein (DUF2235 family)